METILAKDSGGPDEVGKIAHIDHERSMRSVMAMAAMMAFGGGSMRGDTEVFEMRDPSTDPKPEPKPAPAPDGHPTQGRTPKNGTERARVREWEQRQRRDAMYAPTQEDNSHER